jgi:surface protein
MLSIYNFLKIKLCYRTYWKQWLAFLAICFLVFACGGSDGDSDSPCPNQPQLITLEVSNISIDENTDLASATFSGEIQNIQLGANCETFSITNQGFVYSTNIQPTTSDNVVNANGENASANVSDLMPETTYYVRAYLTNTLGTFYGNEVSFTTPESSNPVYLAENGVTIKARDWAEIGDIGVVNGIEYTVVNRNMLSAMLSAGEDLNTACITKIGYLGTFFENHTNFNQDISSWDVSNISSLGGLFISTEFNQDISSWDVSNATRMESMFSGAASFNQDISSWDVSNVTDMTAMFNGAKEFNQNISSWDVSSVTEMNYMFSDAWVFNQDLSSWDVSSVTTMNRMFRNTYSFNQNIGSWDVSNVVDMVAMFEYALVFNQDISDWDVSSVIEMNVMFGTACEFNQDLSSWNVGNVIDCAGFCYQTPNLCSEAPNWTLPKPNFTNCNSGCD